MNDNLRQIHDWFDFIETESQLTEPIKIDKVLEEKMQRLLDRRFAQNLSLDLE